jgi:hypothetical protein
MAGAIQTVRRTADIAALIVKLSTNGDLLFDKQFDGRGGETATGVAVAPDDGTLYVAGTTTSFGRIPRRVRSSPAPDWQEIARRGHLGRNGFRGRLGRWRDRRHDRARRDYHKSATLFVARCLRETFGGPGYAGGGCGNPDQPAGIPADPAAGAATPNGTTIFGGNFEAALVRIAR